MGRNKKQMYEIPIIKMGFAGLIREYNLFDKCDEKEKIIDGMVDDLYNSIPDFLREYMCEKIAKDLGYMEKEAQRFAKAIDFKL